MFGDPESGKPAARLRELAEVLNAGAGAGINLDHNGPEPTVTRLLDFGADEKHSATTNGSCTSSPTAPPRFARLRP